MKHVVRFIVLLLITSVGTIRASGQIAADSLDNQYFSKRRISPMIYYQNPDKIFAGLRFRLSRRLAADTPRGFAQSVQLRYSISQNAFSILYDAKYYRLFGNWNMYFSSYYDWLIWTNFLGLGNDTRKGDSGSTYYRMSTNVYSGSIGINRVFGHNHSLDVSANIRGIEVLDKPGTFVSDNFVNNRAYYFEHHIFTGLHAAYTYQHINDIAVPTKGIMFYAGAGYTANVDEPDKSFASYNSILQVYVPLTLKFGMSFRGGISGIAGTPEFYQYASIGGPRTMRGYIRDRFWGSTAAYNTNELRYITDFRVRKAYGKIGVIALFDDGRVWMDHENSTTLHTAYGAGLLLAPLNKFTGVISYAISAEGGIVQVRVHKGL
jgi:hemolysin activation/secretion protein